MYKKKFVGKFIKPNKDSGNNNDVEIEFICHNNEWYLFNDQEVDDQCLKDIVKAFKPFIKHENIQIIRDLALIKQ